MPFPRRYKFASKGENLTFLLSCDMINKGVENEN